MGPQSETRYPARQASGKPEVRGANPRLAPPKKGLTEPASATINLRGYTLVGCPRLWNSAADCSTKTS